MKIGTKIYFEKNTGNIIMTVRDMIGNVVDTSLEADYNNYLELGRYNIEAIGLIKFDFGEFSKLMSENNADQYYVDITGTEPKVIFTQSEDRKNEPKQKTLDEIINEKLNEVKTELSTAITEIIENTEATKLELSTAITEVIDLMASKEG